MHDSTECKDPTCSFPECMPANPTSWEEQAELDRLMKTTKMKTVFVCYVYHVDFKAKKLVKRDMLTWEAA